MLAALAQALVKIHLAAHRRLRHRRHLVVLAGAARELVDHLLLDDGAVHVEDDEPLRAAQQRLALQRHVALERLAQLHQAFAQLDAPFRRLRVRECDGRVDEELDGRDVRRGRAGALAPRRRARHRRGAGAALVLQRRQPADLRDVEARVGRRPRDGGNLLEAELLREQRDDEALRRAVGVRRRQVVAAHHLELDVQVLAPRAVEHRADERALRRAVGHRDEEVERQVVGAPRLAPRLVDVVELAAGVRQHLGELGGDAHRVAARHLEQQRVRLGGGRGERRVIARGGGGAARQRRRYSERRRRRQARRRERRPQRAKHHQLRGRKFSALTARGFAGYLP